MMYDGENVSQDEQSNGTGKILTGPVSNTTQRDVLGGGRSPRVIYWFTFFLISIITLGSSIEAVSKLFANEKELLQKI